MIEQPCLQPGRGARETRRCRDQENHSRHQWHHQADHAERDHHPTQTEVDDPHQTCRPSVSSSKDRSLPVDALAGHQLLHGSNEMERVKGIEPSYSAWKSRNLVVFSKAVLTFSAFWPIEIITE